MSCSCKDCNSFFRDHKKCAKKRKEPRCCGGVLCNCQDCTGFSADHKKCAKKLKSRRCCCGKIVGCRNCSKGVGMNGCHRCEDLKKNGGRCCHGHNHKKCSECTKFGGDCRKCKRRRELKGKCCCGKDLKNTKLPPPEYWGW